ncbi:hypothetical protein D4A92_12000 [Rhizobium rosettiformans]|uniref:Uncharacterized protein n=1 Tax=Rhizobium rosettiformans TaxID=1368430 RepID=A0ABX7EUU1_9HYPH|nr:hypothetical protein [Rhizobium rosettiformans]QRF52110.1 hypothetical protein D4A92_12000 [Rhizobium rosettiformans]
MSALDRSDLVRDGPKVVICEIQLSAATRLAEVLMLRLFCVALSLLFIVAPASAEMAISPSLPLVLVNDADGAISESQNTPRQTRPARPQRYICVIDQSGSIGGGGQVSCPANPGRVGGRCRCANVTGSGTLLTY